MVGLLALIIRQVMSCLLCAVFVVLMHQQEREGESTFDCHVKQNLQLPHSLSDSDDELVLQVLFELCNNYIIRPKQQQWMLMIEGEMM